MGGKDMMLSQIVTGSQKIPNIKENASCTYNCMLLVGQKTRRGRRFLRKTHVGETGSGRTGRHK
jgi:hypothetical protein